MGNKKLHVLFALLLTGYAHLYATTWLVGPTRTYTMPSQVSTLVQNGDTVLIDSATYNSDVAHWTANNLVLKGVGGLAHLKSNGQNYGGKAIWVISGSNTTVESVEFSRCTCVDNNGAGIRQEGSGLTVRHCYFHDNENGILTNADTTSDILIEYTQFNNNGYGDGFSHNLYVGHINSLTFQYNYTHHAKVGHELKSRAKKNYILYNRIANGATGTASREIDLPNGGLAILIGNEIEQGPLTQNSNIVGFGLEGLSNIAPHQLYGVNNTVVNERLAGGSFISIENGTDLCKAYNNIFAGPGTVISGYPTTIDSSHNFYTTLAGAGFVDTAIYDYHLIASSPAVEDGVAPGIAGAYSLTPAKEYVHPNTMINRATNGALDIGAHEYGTASTGISTPAKDGLMLVYPNPSFQSWQLEIVPEWLGCNIEITDNNGKIVYRDKITQLKTEIAPEVAPGIYFMRIYSEEKRVNWKLIRL